MEQVGSGIDAERLPPQDLEAEQAALGAMLVGSREAVAAVAETLRPDDFYRDAHGTICRACFNLFERDEAVDMVTVGSELRLLDRFEAVGGFDYLDRLVRSTPYSMNAAHYAQVVKEKALLRSLLFASHKVAARCYEPGASAREVLDRAEAEILALAQARTTRDFEHVKPVANRVYEQVEQRYYERGALSGLSTGYGDLDRMLAGFQPGDLVVLAARPSMGKTSLAICFALNAALRSDKPTPAAIFSLEMAKELVVGGMICTHARVNLGRWRTGQLRQQDWESAAASLERLSRAPIFIDDTSAMSPLEMRAKARRLDAEHKLGLIVVDYLQLMRSDERTENRVNEISAVTRSLKGLAKELRVPVVACAQLSRAVESRDNKRPMLSDLRESGQIEADADVVMFIYRDSYYQKKEAAPEAQADDVYDDDPEPDEAEVIVAKQRNGPTGAVKLGFIRQQKRFVNLERRYDD